MRGGARGIGAALLVLAAGACSGNRAARQGAEADTASTAGAAARRPAMVAGAVGSITAEDLRNTHYTRVEQILARIPGVEVTRRGGDYTIRIRGTSSFSGHNEPLVVIDGVAAGSIGALAGLEPQEIERIDVLKDAGGYGVRGAAGVIVITTKR